jgi:crotonobetainyl-CoA:carnitine CoA-transferase CaiB-like acyl-CoA transferase
MTAGALAGFRIIDLTQALAGPYCTQLLADHGADVIKVEQPTGDFARGNGPHPKDDTLHNYGGIFQNCNRNKRSIVLDLKSPAGKETLLKLVDTADALVENFRVGVMERLGLSYETLAARNPKLVYATVRGFGDPRSGKSPYADWQSYDPVSQAMSGIVSITGPNPDTVSLCGPALGDTIPGLMLSYGVLLALLEAQKSGRGQFVDVAMIDAVASLCESIFLSYGYNREVPKPNNRLNHAPSSLYRTKDGWAALSAPHVPQWVEVAKLIGRPDMIDDPRFSTDHERARHRAEVDAAVQEFFIKHTKKELMAILGGKVPFAPVFDAADIFQDPHYQIRDMLPVVDHPGSQQKVEVVGVPIKLSRTPGGVRRRAPLLGEHTEEILNSVAAGKS